MAEPRLSFSFKIYRRTFRVPVRTSQGLWHARDGVLVRLECEDGRVGFGEIAPIERFGTETIAGAVAWCASVNGTVDVARLRGVPHGLPCCTAAVHAALAAMPAELASSHAGRGADPGAGTNSGPAVARGRLAVASLLPIGSGARDALSRAADAGFLTFKLKIGTTDFATEHATLARLLERLPAGGRLRLDANGGLDVRTAVHWLEAAADWPVEFVEQPLPVTAERDLVRLANDHATPLALDESVRDADDIKRWRDRSWQGLFVIKPALAGAPDEVLREVGIAPDAFVFSSALETAIGARAGLRLAFAAGVTRALGYGVGGFFADDGLGGGVAQASLHESDLADWKLEETWKRL